MYIILRKDNGQRVKAQSGKKSWARSNNAKAAMMIGVDRSSLLRLVKNQPSLILYKTYNKEIVDIALNYSNNELHDYIKSLGNGKYKNQFDMYFGDILEVISVTDYTERVLNSYKGMLVEDVTDLILAELNDVLEG